MWLFTSGSGREGSDALHGAGWQWGPGPGAQKSASSCPRRASGIALGTGGSFGASVVAAGTSQGPRRGREWLCLSFPDAELLERAGEFPKHFVVRGFPSCSPEREEVSMETAKGRAAGSGPAPFLPWWRGGRGGWGTEGHLWGPTGAQEAGRDVGHWASASSRGSHGAVRGHIQVPRPPCCVGATAVPSLSGTLPVRTAAAHPAVSCPAGRPSRSHSTMSLSARPQRRVLVAKINRSQSFAGVNSTADRPFR